MDAEARPPHPRSGIDAYDVSGDRGVDRVGLAPATFVRLTLHPPPNTAALNDTQAIALTRLVVKPRSRNGPILCSDDSAIRGDGCTLYRRRWLLRKTTLAPEEDETCAPKTDANASNGEI